MATTDNHPGTTDEKIEGMRAQLDALDTEAAADPIALTDDINAWARRDQARRDRRIALEREIRAAQQFGRLLDNPGAMDAIRAHANTTAEARTKLKHVREHRRFRQGTDGRPVAALENWWTETVKLAAVLPADDPDATRHLAAEFDEWFAARDGLASAYCLASDFGVDIPAPEATGGLPAGFRYGAHRVVQA